MSSWAGSEWSTRPSAKSPVVIAAAAPTKPTHQSNVAPSRQAFTDRYNLPRWGAFVATAVLAWLLMLVIGVMAKIVSHLSYQHFFRTMPGVARAASTPTVQRDATRTSTLRSVSVARF